VGRAALFSHNPDVSGINKADVGGRDIGVVEHACVDLRLDISWAGQQKNYSQKPKECFFHSSLHLKFYLFKLYSVERENL
jgi:hypothetical protein